MGDAAIISVAISTPRHYLKWLWPQLWSLTTF